MTRETGTPWYVSERAEKTALLWLTEGGMTDQPDAEPARARRPEKTITVETNVSEQRDDKFIESDVRVTLTDRDKKAVFYLHVKGTTDTRQWISPDGAFNSESYLPTCRSLARLNAPAAVMVVNVKNRAAWFGWIVPPAGSLSVLSSKDVKMRLATDALLHQIVDEVLPGFAATETAPPAPALPG